MLIRLGSITFGVNNTYEGPTGASEALINTINEHDVVRGKKPLQDAGEDNDRRTYKFFFDESFCDPAAEYAALHAARSSRSVMPLSVGRNYSGKHFVVTNVQITLRKTDTGGSPVRLEGKVHLVEAPRSGLSIGGIGQATSTLAGLNPLVRN